MPDAVEFLRELVRIPTVSVQSNRPLIRYVTRILEDAGWSAHEFPYPDAAGVEKVNLVATPADQSASSDLDLALVCHTDTVPYAATWDAATRLTERHGSLHGCGACDVKGALAGILAAIGEVPVATIEKRVALILTADEEVGCLGASRLLASIAVRARQVMICEPTSLSPASAGKGYGLARVRVSGREAHSAFPQQGVSAVYAAAEAILAVRAWAREFESTRNHLFDPPFTTVNVGTLEGGTAKNIIAGECRFQVEWRPIPADDPQIIGESLQQMLSELAERHPGLSIDVEILRAEPGFENAPHAGLASQLQSLTGTKITGISFGSEASRFAKIAEEVVVIGPGDMRTAHSDRECLPVSELNLWVDCVRELLVAPKA